MVPGTGLGGLVAPGWGGWFASIRDRWQQVPGTLVNSHIGMLAIDSGGLGGKR
jgi:hypothetical protein